MSPITMLLIMIGILVMEFCIFIGIRLIFVSRDFSRREILLIIIIVISALISTILVLKIFKEKMGIYMSHFNSKSAFVPINSESCFQTKLLCIFKSISEIDAIDNTSTRIVILFQQGISKDENGFPMLKVSDEKAFRLFEKIIRNCSMEGIFVLVYSFCDHERVLSAVQDPCSTFCQEGIVEESQRLISVALLNKMSKLVNIPIFIDRQEQKVVLGKQNGTAVANCKNSISARFSSLKSKNLARSGNSIVNKRQRCGRTSSIKMITVPKLTTEFAKTLYENGDDIDCDRVRRFVSIAAMIGRLIRIRKKSMDRQCIIDWIYMSDTWPVLVNCMMWSIYSNPPDSDLNVGIFAKRLSSMNASFPGFGPVEHREKFVAFINDPKCRLTVSNAVELDNVSFYLDPFCRQYIRSASAFEKSIYTLSKEDSESVKVLATHASLSAMSAAEVASFVRKLFENSTNVEEYCTRILINNIDGQFLHKATVSKIYEVCKISIYASRTLNL
ncbi:hypothetical protein ACOME3_007781 [Neoechinorhynchus agilis]